METYYLSRTSLIHDIALFDTAQHTILIERQFSSQRAFPLTGENLKPDQEMQVAFRRSQLLHDNIPYRVLISASH